MVYGRKKAGATATRVSLSKWILYAAIRLVCEKHFVLVTDPFLAKGVLQWQKERKDRPAGKQDRSCTLVAKPPSFSRSNSGKKVFA